MMEPYEYTLRFISLRIICPKTQLVIIEAQRAVHYINNEPDWKHLDEVVSMFLDSNAIEEYKQLTIPQPHPGGGWVTHSFDMGCPRLIWIFPDPVGEMGVANP